MQLNLKTVIINLNLKDDTAACIDSLIQSGLSPDHIIVVDNGSTDGSVSAFQQRYENKVSIIINKSNLGFAEASNQGFQEAVNKGAEWVLLLNNDTEVRSDFFKEIEIELDNPKFKIYSPVIFYHSAPDFIWHMGTDLISGTMITRNRFEGKTLPDNLPDIFEVDFISGCAMIIHKDVYQELGLFDAKLIIYWEEVEFCWKARLAGYNMGIITKAVMWHKVSKTMDKEKPQARYFRTRNMVRFYKKYALGMQRIIMFTFAIAKSMLIIVQDIIHNRVELIKPLMSGWRDGLRGF
jgi:GT2 family glycosyltransferase